MKKLVLGLLFSIPLVAGDITISVTNSSQVLETLRQDLSKWVADPIIATGCNTGDCCVSPATDTQCVSLARAAKSSPDFWIKQIYTCLQADSDWQCHIEKPNGSFIMYCQTIPATDSLRLGDLAGCLSEQAAVQF